MHRPAETAPVDEPEHVQNPRLHVADRITRHLASQRRRRFHARDTYLGRMPMAHDVTLSMELTDREYELFRKLVYAHSGINLGAEKQHLVRARLGKRLRK